MNNTKKKLSSQAAFVALLSGCVLSSPITMASEEFPSQDLLMRDQAVRQLADLYFAQSGAERICAEYSNLNDIEEKTAEGVNLLLEKFELAGTDFALLAKEEAYSKMLREMERDREFALYETFFAFATPTRKRAACAQLVEEYLGVLGGVIYLIAREPVRPSGQEPKGLDPVTQFYLARRYANGDGITQDDREAVLWYRLSAEQGFAPAQLNLGLMYLYGNGAPQDDAEAVRWWRLAAEQDHPTAKNNLGFMFDRGRGVPQDSGEAVRWYRLAAEQGDALGQYGLAVMYFAGRGVPQDKGLAYMWYHIASVNDEGNRGYSASRDNVAREMKPSAIAEVQRRAQICIESDYRDCDWGR